jgi:GT2 family glycosyltransferase
MDADLILNQKALNFGINAIKNGDVFYPTIKYNIEPNSDKLMNHEGGGIVFMRKDIFHKVGKWPEYWQYGFEDTEMVKKVKQVAKIVTTEDVALFHQWHPQSSSFKNKYGKTDAPNQEQYNKTKVNCIDEVKRTEEEMKRLVGSIINDKNVMHPQSYKNRRNYYGQ